ncbi:MAG: hypothetical protein ACYC9L_08270 [Sulfuricaulis sp.]
MLMLVTRLPPAAAVTHLQDASWAVFFIAGFYFTKQWRWAFPVLMIEAVVIDYVAIAFLGVSNYCVTPAYWFLVPAYAALWEGGSWLERYHSMDARGLGLFAISLVGALSLSYFISNASFYWIGDRVAGRSFDGWVTNFGDWYWPMLRTPLLYGGVAALVHFTVIQIAGSQLAGRRTAMCP